MLEAMNSNDLGLIKDVSADLRVDIFQQSDQAKSTEEAAMGD